MTGPHLLAAVAYDEYYNDTAANDGRLRQAAAPELHQAGRGRLQAPPDRRALFHRRRRRARSRRPSTSSTWRIEDLPDDVHVMLHICQGNYAVGPDYDGQIGHRYFDVGRYKADLVCRIDCDGYLIEHDMTHHYERLLGDKQLGVGAVDVQAPNVETGEQVAERIRAPSLAGAGADDHHQLVRLQPPAPPYRARQAAGHDRGQGDPERQGLLAAMADAATPTSTEPAESSARRPRSGCAWRRSPAASPRSSCDLATGAWTLSAHAAGTCSDRERSEPPTFEEVARSVFPDDLPKISAAVEAAPARRALLRRVPGAASGKGVHWLAGRGRTVGADGSARLCAAPSTTSAERKALEARLLALNETLEARVAEVARRSAGARECSTAPASRLPPNLDLERLVQMVTDAGVELAGAEFGAFFYNVVSERGRSLHALHAVGRAARGVREVPDAAQYRDLRADLPRTADRALRRHSGRSALRQERALSRHAQGPSAGAQLSRGAGRRRAAARCSAGYSSAIRSRACSPSAPSAL